MSETAAFRILDAAWALGVRAFDTAEAYGPSAQRLRAWIDSRGNAELLEVITKCSVHRQASREALEESAEKAVSRFENVRRAVLLTHGPVSAEQWPALLAVSARRHAAVGQSVYSPEEVRAACELPGIERLQAPGNVLDYRAIKARGSSVTPVDIRSVYLQGVLLDAPEVANLRAPGSAKIVAAIHSAAATLGSPLAPLLVAAMLCALSPGDRLVIGVDGVNELEVLPAAFAVPDSTVRQFQEEVNRATKDTDLSIIVDPRRWPTLPAA